jgi:diguanylate cyclase (GGDEF)-like protein
MRGLQRRNQELATLVEIGKALTSTLNLEELLNLIMEKISLLLQSRNWSLALLDETSGDLVFEIAVSPAGDRLKGMRLAVGEGIAGWVAAHGEPLLVPDVQADQRFAKRIDETLAFSTHSVVAVPMRSRNRVLGVMELINSMNDGKFTEADLSILTTLADYAAIAIENARNFEKIHQMTITDELTGLFNGRHLHQLIGHEVERCRRYGGELSLVFIDLDHFKQVNDTRGHQVGSRLLSEVGAFLCERIRKVDMAARYGGDEFIILLPATDKKGAFIMASKLQEQLEEHRFHAGEGEGMRVTASFGLASYPEDAQGKEELIRLADMAMYRAKESRNTVCSA